MLNSRWKHYCKLGLEVIKQNYQWTITRCSNSVGFIIHHCSIGALLVVSSNLLNLFSILDAVQTEHHEMKNWHFWPVTSHYPIFSYGSLNFGARNKAERKSPSPNREPHCCILRWKIIDWLATLASANWRFHIQLWFFEFYIMPKKNL